MCELFVNIIIDNKIRFRSSTIQKVQCKPGKNTVNWIRVAVLIYPAALCICLIKIV